MQMPQGESLDFAWSGLIFQNGLRALRSRVVHLLQVQ